MSRIILGLAFTCIANVSIASSDPQCAEYNKLRTQRDNALSTKNFKQYCDALSGLMKLMPTSPPERARLQCEAKATNMKIETWLGIRASVLETTKETFDEQCKS